MAASSLVSSHITDSGSIASPQSTSSSSSSAATTILVSCKQTRFHIENPVYSELDIEGLNIIVTSSSSSSSSAAVKSTSKGGKGKAKTEGLEILSNATLKVKAGVCYALIGRNGTGKSSLLKAIAQKLIPGIPLQTRISLLQQTASVGSDTEINNSATSNLSVLGEVIDRATSRNDLQREIDILSKGIDSPQSILAPLRALRQVHHERLKKELFELDKDARLRSGTRGMAARKALLAFEKKVTESEARLAQNDEEIPEEVVKEETAAASDLLADLQSQLEPARLAEIEVKARRILSGLGFPKSNLEKPVSTLSGGWRMRTNLASALLQPTDILILDEPTNFLDLLGIIWLQRYLLQLREESPNPPTTILVSHDRDFINTVCEEVIILRDQDLTYFRGNLDSYDISVREKKLHLTKMKDAQEKQKSHMQQTIQQNIKQGKAAGDENKLRQAKSRQKKLDNRMGMEKSATGGRFKLNRDLAGYHFTARAEIDIPADERGVSITIPEAEIRFPGRALVSMEKVSFHYSAASKKLTIQPPNILTDTDLTIYMGDRIGIVGLNGSGKTTFVNLLTQIESGLIKPTKGTVAHHPRLKMGYYSQHSVEDLQVLGRTNPSLTALALLTSDVESLLDEGELRGLLGSLGLPGRTASDVPIVNLSGGQLVRLALARLLWRGPQLLVLDEVTTHLDFFTVKALAIALEGWNGAVVVVSHDRAFVRWVVQGEKGLDVGLDGGSDSEEEEDQGKRRIVYLLKGGTLKGLENGVKDFEESLERRVEKLLGA